MNKDFFLDEVYQYCLNAGAIGFGWWNFQDVEEIAYKAQFTGLLNNVGETYTSDSTHKIIGSLKPAALNFTGLDSLTPKELVRPVNYFNMLGYENICITGKILDKNTNKPIEGAVIRGWTEYWSIGMNTYTDENGNFTLYCNAPAKYFAVSAPGMETKDFKKNLDYTNITDTVYDIDNLPNKELEFQTIAYYPFIFNPEQRRTYDGDEPYVFNFDSAKFSRKKFTADLGEIYLNSLF